MTVAALLSAAVGCRDSEPKEQPSPPDIRIVSLSPAISRTLADFHLESSVVGRTPWCEAIDRSIPVVGDLFNLDLEAIVRSDPTHVLVQPPAEGLDPELTRLADERGWQLAQCHLDSMDDIEQLVRELPGVLYAEDRTGREVASARAAEIINDLAQALTPGGAAVFTGRTLIVKDFDPLMAFGPGSFVHDMLLAVGGRNASETGAYRTLSLEDVVRLDPEAIIVLRAHADPDERPLAMLGPLAACDITAVRTGRVALLANPDANMPSTGLIGVVDDLREILVSFAATEP